MAAEPLRRGPIASLRCRRFSMTWERSIAWAMRAPAPAVSTPVWAARGVAPASNSANVASFFIGIRSECGVISGHATAGMLQSTCTHAVPLQLGAGCDRRPGATIFAAEQTPPPLRIPEDPAVPKDSLTITDNRTGSSYDVPVSDGMIKAMDLRQIRVSEEDFGLMTYDPAFMNTAACRSAITYIDGDRGILRYRGYPIEELAERASFLEVAYLLSAGELPTAPQLEKWTQDIKYHTYVHTNIIKFLEGFRYDAHPMGMLLGVVGALSTFYPDAKDVHDPENRYIQRVRLMAKIPTLAAFVFRQTRGLPYQFPRNDLDYIGNYVNMTFSIGGQHKPNLVLQRALEILLILHADHEQNCSTSAVRAVGSSGVDPFSAISAGIAALYGPLHGGEIGRASCRERV